MKTHESSLRKLLCLVILLLVTVSAAGGQQTPLNHSALGASSSGKPQLVVSVLDGTGSYSLARSCETGGPMLYVKARVTNQSRTPSPAGLDGVVVQDVTSQTLTGAAGLPAIPAGTPGLGGLGMRGTILISCVLRHS